MYFIKLCTCTQQIQKYPVSKYFLHCPHIDMLILLCISNWLKHLKIIRLIKYREKYWDNIFVSIVMHWKLKKRKLFYPKTPFQLSLVWYTQPKTWPELEILVMPLLCYIHWIMGIKWAREYINIIWVSWAITCCAQWKKRFSCGNCSRPSYAQSGAQHN